MLYLHYTYIFTLQAIHNDHHTIQGCFTAMVGEWLQSSPNPTWSELVEALRSPDIRSPDIAAEIEDKYIKSDDSSVQETKDTAGECISRVTVYYTYLERKGKAIGCQTS